jgi:prevent-host-death family protein
MTIITVDSREARTQWRTILDAARANDIVITRYGKPVATMIDYEDWLAVQEELDELRAARRAVEAVEVWEKDPSTAKPLSVFKAELVAEGLLDTAD